MVTNRWKEVRGKNLQPVDSVACNVDTGQILKHEKSKFEEFFLLVNLPLCICKAGVDQQNWENGKRSK